MKALLTVFFVYMFSVSYAQTADIVNTQKPFKEGDSVYQAADFTGGNQQWVKYIEKNLHPETPADHKAPPGIYMVVASFAIDTAGNVIEVKILQDPGYGTIRDVTHLLNKSPKWLPATINGKPVLFRQKQNFYYRVSEQ